MKTIWCLFSVANEYNQPENNLEAFWFIKPTIEQLTNTSISFDIHEATWLLDGEKVRSPYYEFRLQEVEENKLL